MDPPKFRRQKLVILVIRNFAWRAKVKLECLRFLQGHPNHPISIYLPIFLTPAILGALVQQPWLLGLRCEAFEQSLCPYISFAFLVKYQYLPKIPDY